MSSLGGRASGGESSCPRSSLLICVWPVSLLVLPLCFWRPVGPSYESSVDAWEGRFRQTSPPVSGPWVVSPLFGTCRNVAICVVGRRGFARPPTQLSVMLPSIPTLSDRLAAPWSPVPRMLGPLLLLPSKPVWPTADYCSDYYTGSTSPRTTTGTTS